MLPWFAEHLREPCIGKDLISCLNCISLNDTLTALFSIESYFSLPLEWICLVSNYQFSSSYEDVFRSKM